MDVEEPWRHDPIPRVNDVGAGESLTNRDDLPAVHSNIGPPRRRTGAVDDGPPFDDEVSVHPLPTIGVGDDRRRHVMAEQRGRVAPGDLLCVAGVQPPDLLPEDLL